MRLKVSALASHEFIAVNVAKNSGDNYFMTDSLTMRRSSLKLYILGRPPLLAECTSPLRTLFCFMIRNTDYRLTSYLSKSISLYTEDIGNFSFLAIFRLCGLIIVLRAL